jgi:hypothetical protein
MREREGSLRGEHCLTTGSAAAEYGHVEFTENEPTETIATNGKTGNETKEAALTKLKGIVAGIELELTATGAESTGTMVNERVAPGEESEGEHYIEGTGTIVYTGVIVAKPAKGCKVFTDEGGKAGTEGIVDTNSPDGYDERPGRLPESRTKHGSRPDHLLHFGMQRENPRDRRHMGNHRQPEVSSSGCDSQLHSLGNHNPKTLKGTSSVKAPLKPGLEGALTISGRVNFTEPYTPLSATTVETP